jgi:hypothetical protein
MKVQRIECVKPRYRRTNVSEPTAVDFEFGVNREEHARAADMIISAALHTGSIFWNQLAFLQSGRACRFLRRPVLVEMRHKPAAQMDAIAASVVRKGPVPAAYCTALAPAVMSCRRLRNV